MRRDVEDVRVVEERVLGAVSVVDVPVDDRDPLEAARTRVRRCDRDVVEQAEAHRVVRPRVMPGRPHEGDPSLRAPVEQRIDHRDGAARRELRDRDALRPDIGVGVDVALLAVEGAQPLHELRIVHARELLVRDRARLDRRERQLGTLDRSPCGLEAFRPLGVVPVRAVPKKPGVGEKNGVSHELPQRTRR